MDTEKRVLAAALLSAIVISFYSQAALKMPGTGSASATKFASANESSGSQRVGSGKPAESLMNPLQEDVVSISSESLSIEIGASSGTVKSAVLRKFLDNTKSRPMRFGGKISLLAFEVDREPLAWKLIDRAENRAEFEATDHNRNKYRAAFSLPDTENLLEVRLSMAEVVTPADGELVALSAWEKADELGGRNNQLELTALTDDGHGRKSYKRTFPSHAPRNVPRGTLIASLCERYFCQSVMTKEPASATTFLSSQSQSNPAVLELKQQISGAAFSSLDRQFSIYIGPRDYFYLKEAGFESAFPIGVLEQIGLILLTILKWVAGVTGNYGVAIIVLSSLVTCLIAPFTLIGLRSMRKMQELKPTIDSITAQHKNDAQRANKEIFQLYKEHKISPLSGCLPMMLQIPVFIALFKAISHFIELRGKSFLWISDLSMPDRIAQLPFSLPIFGKDVNVLPIVMAVAMYVQTKISQAGMPKNQSDISMNVLSGPLMPVLFGAMFYHVPSGLVLYWLTNTLITLVWFKRAKRATT